MDGMDEIDAAPPQPAMQPAEMLQAIMAAGNVADLLPDDELARLGSTVVREHVIDEDSMKPWRERMDTAIKLAALIKDDKTYPFPKAANVKYPLVTTAALQFNARAYPAIVPPADAVKVRVHGRDPQGVKAARAERVSAHMSYQVLSAIREWERSIDEMLVTLPIVGTVIRKVWYDPAIGRARVRNIRPGNFIINASASDMVEAPRVGEVLPLYPGEIAERIRSGVFREADYVEKEGEDADAPQEFIEQHRREDLDGDGYAEPYIVTVHRRTMKVARVVADFEPQDVSLGQDGRVMSIRRGAYFVAYRMLPPLDGGFFGTGFGYLLGDVSETINGIINMMLDAGHMASRGGGFIGGEFRLKGGAQQFKPGEWKMVPEAGRDIRSAIVPLTFPAPDATLFQLLGLMIEAARDVASVKDILTGDTQRTMTATTTLALIEQGMAVFTAAYKRIFASLKEEFSILARINGQTLDPMEYAMFHDEQADPRADYDLRDMDIEPVSDPRSVTRMQEAAKAEIVMQLAQAGMVDQAEAMKRILEAASIPDVEALAPKPSPAAQMMEQMQMQAAQADLTLRMVAVDQALADLEKTRAETIKTMTDAAATDAKVRLDQAKAALEAVRDGLAATLGRGAGGMAGAPGNAGNAGGYGGNAPAGAGPMPFGLLGGQPVAGSGAGVAGPAGGMGGGLL
jgi:chaperonin GroES